MRPQFPPRRSQPPTPDTYRRAAGRIRHMADQIEDRAEQGAVRVAAALHRLAEYVRGLQDRHQAANPEPEARPQGPGDGYAYCPRCERSCLTTDAGETCARCGLVL